MPAPPRRLVDRVLPVALICSLVIWPWAAVPLMLVWELHKLRE